MSYDVIIIGAGANGLIAATALGRAGKRVLLLEQQEMVGGLARVVEFAPGFRASAASAQAGWVPPAVARELKLTAAIHADAPLSVVSGGEALTLWRDSTRATQAIGKYSPRDAAGWPAFMERYQRLASFLGELYQQLPPDVDTSAPSELLGLLKTGRKLRALGKTEMIEFLRVMPMAVQELVDDTFEAEILKAAIAASGVRNIRQGPRSGGTTFNLLHHMVGTAPGALRHAHWWREGNAAFIGAAEQAARRHNVTIRTNTEVARILVRDDAVAGVVLGNGEEIAATRVISTADPVRTMLGLVDPVWLDPEYLHALRNIKLRGSTATILFGLAQLPQVAGLSDDALKGTVSLTGATIELEKAADAAKYQQISARPHVEFFIPSLYARQGELAPAGKHTMVARVQWVPFDADPAEVARRALAVITEAIPNFSSLVEQQAVFTPAELQRVYGVTEGALTHGELMLDQILFMRPVAGFGRYATPISGLYLGGAGTHPGPEILGGAGILAGANFR